MNKKDLKNELITHWAVLCRTASVDQQSNLLSMFSVLEELKVSEKAISSVKKMKDEKISIPLDFTLVVQNEKVIYDTKALFSPEIRVQVFDPTSKELLKNDIPLTFKLNEKRMRTIISFQQMILTVSGDYLFVVSTKSSKDEAFERSASAKLEVAFI